MCVVFSNFKHVLSRFIYFRTQGNKARCLSVSRQLLLSTTKSGDRYSRRCGKFARLTYNKQGAKTQTTRRYNASLDNRQQNRSAVRSKEISSCTETFLSRITTTRFQLASHWKRNMFLRVLDGHTCCDPRTTSAVVGNITG